MRLLAIDTALAACSVAIYDTEIGLVAKRSEDMARGHAEALMPMIESLMRDAHASFDEIERFAVTVGPGSFTGLRVGVSAARGLALASGKAAVGITTLAAFHASPTEHAAAPTLVVIDARNENVFMEAFGTDGHSLAPPRMATFAEAIESSPPGPVHLIGNAALMLGERWPSQRPAPLIDGAFAPDIAAVARLGVAASPATAPAKPFYLQQPNTRAAVASLRTPR